MRVLVKVGELNFCLLEVCRLVGIFERKLFSFLEGLGCLFFFMSEFVLLDVREFGFVEVGKGLFLEEIGFWFEFKFLVGVFFLVVMLFLEGEVLWLNLDWIGEVFLFVMLLIEGDGVFKVLLCVGDVFLIEGFLEGDIFWISGFVGFVVVDEMDGLDVISGWFEIVFVFCCCCGEENIVEVFVNVGWEDFIIDVDLVVEVVVVWVIEFDLVVDGELECIGLVIWWGEEDFIVEVVEVGEEEFFDEIVFGFGFFVEVLKVGWGFLEVLGFWGWGFLIVLGFWGWGFLEVLRLFDFFGFLLFFMGFGFFLGVVVIGFLMVGIFW